MRGLAIVALGYAVIAVADATVKWVLPTIGPAAAMVWRGVFGGLTVLLLSRGRALRAVNRRLLAARSLLSAGVSAAWYLAWSLGVSLADSYAVAAASPLLMTLLAIPLLGETVGWRRWCSTAVGCAGVLFMLQPGGELWRPESALLLAATAVMALTRIWTRMLTRTDTPDSMAFWVLAAQAPVGLALLAWPAMWPPGGPPPVLPPAWALATLAGFALLNALAQILFGRGYALAPVSAIAPFEYTPLLWGIGLGFLLWGEVPAWTTLGGAAIVVAAGLYNVHRERLRRSAERAARPRGAA
ncbi:EamA family transporter [Roseicella frigidaeris]|uniref:EamA family transporter n=1 Tax=Roseicella frigidaeris TaxID=2230885 RepID=A0A327ME36_9PROT|nr:EamA family transporter [Roseicella frigidaeris]